MFGLFLGSNPFDHILFVFSFGFHFLYNIHQCEWIYIVHRQTYYRADFWIIYYWYCFCFHFCKIWQWNTNEEKTQRKRINHRSPFINYKSNAAGLALGFASRFYVWFRFVYCRYIRIRYNFTLCTTTYYWANKIGWKWIFRVHKLHTWMATVASKIWKISERASTFIFISNLPMFPCILASIASLLIQNIETRTTRNAHNNGPNKFWCRRKFLLSNDHLWKVVFGK